LHPTDYDLVLVLNSDTLSEQFRKSGFPTVALGNYNTSASTARATLPPIIDTRLSVNRANSPYTLVYLPHKSSSEIKTILDRVENRRFIVYAHEQMDESHTHMDFRAYNHKRLRQDLCGATSVVSELDEVLATECFHLGIPLLLESGAAQKEHQKTAEALHQVGLAHSARKLTPLLITLWLDSNPRLSPLQLPDLAQMMVQCIQQNQTSVYDALCRLSPLMWDALPVELKKLNVS